MDINAINQELQSVSANIKTVQSRLHELDSEKNLLEVQLPQLIQRQARLLGQLDIINEAQSKIPPEVKGT